MSCWATMNTPDPQKLPPYAPFPYELVISLLDAATTALDPVLQDIDGYRELDLIPDGRPAPPDHVAQRLGQLPGAVVVQHVGACIAATTNLGLAFAHSFRLLNVLTRNVDALPANAQRVRLAKLYDALPAESRTALGEIYNSMGSHDFEIEITAGSRPPGNREQGPSGARSFRSTLAYWDSHGLMHESHLSLTSGGRASALCVYVPLRSVLVLDRILADHIAPVLGRDYKSIVQQLSSRTEDPQLKWDGEMILVSLPDNRGRIIEARWNPSVTSVIRIREKGAASWSPGFETPFNMCSFVGLNPDAEYEVQLTHKNEAGESEPAVSTIKTAPQSK